MSTAESSGAASAVAAPSINASVSMVCRYESSSMTATVAPTLRSKVTSPSASSRRIASRTGTTLTAEFGGDGAEHEPVAGQ